MEIYIPEQPMSLTESDFWVWVFKEVIQNGLNDEDGTVVSAGNFADEALARFRRADKNAKNIIKGETK